MNNEDDSCPEESYLPDQPLEPISAKIKNPPTATSTFDLITEKQ
ncbi:Uncharacterized protein PPKH_2106 [Pseudomonas putida]|nr:Uncharacterized protein PPKH_2106 [Pseudomonas putida]